MLSKPFHRVGLVLTAIALVAAASVLAFTAAGRTPAAHPGHSPVRILKKLSNPHGAVAVPQAGRAADTSHPSHVIGTGTPASCTYKAVDKAVAEGGIIRFNCGPRPVTIPMHVTATVAKTEHLVVLDGGGKVTLSGGGTRRILFSDTCLGTKSTPNCISQPYPQIVVQNITFRDGYDGTHQATCTANKPKCWYGGVDGGGAIYAQGGQFKAVNSQFIDNTCYSHGPDLGGGAIRVLAQYQDRPVYVTGDTFTGGRCSNGAALSSINVNWDVYNSVFTNNAAIGWGKNPTQPGTLGGGSGGAIYADGRAHDLLIAGTFLSGNTAREGGGALFFVVNSGGGTLKIASSTLKNNLSGEFQNAPGIFDNVNLVNTQPVEVNSTVS